MAGVVPKLFRYSWGFAVATLGTLASTMAVAAALFRYLARDAVNGTGHCAPAVLEGVDVYCQLGVGLARIAMFLNFGAIAIGAGAFFAAWQWWAQRGTAATGGFHDDAGAGGDGDSGGGGD